MMEISERLVADGNQVTVLTTDAIDIQHYWLPGKEKIDCPREYRNGVEIRRFKVRRFPWHARALKAFSWIPGMLSRCLFSFPSPLVPGLVRFSRSAEQFDIVHVTAFPYDSLAYTAWRYASRHRVPWVCSPFLHLGEDGNDEVSRHYTRPHQLRLLAGADAVTVQTGIERDYLVGRGLSPDRLVMLGMGINPAELEGGKGERFRQQHGLIGPLVCYIGPKTFDKGTVHLLEAMQLLWKAGSPATLVLAGADIEDFRRYYRELPEEVRSKCLMLDFVSDRDKKDLLDACSMLVLPSRSDSFGIVLLEAWYYGKPVIGARAGGIPGVIRDGVDGFLVPFGNKVELAGSIRNLLQELGVSRMLGEEGRRRVLAEYTWDDKYAIVKDLYQRLAGSRGAPPGEKAGGTD